MHHRTHRQPLENERYTPESVRVVFGSAVMASGESRLENGRSVMDICDAEKHRNTLSGAHRNHPAITGPQANSLCKFDVIRA